MNELLLLAGAANTIRLHWTGKPVSKSLWRWREKRGSLAVFLPPPLLPPVLQGELTRTL